MVEGQTANGRCSIRVRVHSLPQQVAAALDDNEAIMSRSLADDSGEQSLHDPKEKATAQERDNFS